MLTIIKGKIENQIGCHSGPTKAKTALEEVETRMCGTVSIQRTVKEIVSLSSGRKITKVYEQICEKVIQNQEWPG